MFRPQYFSSALANDDTASLDVSGDYAGHYRSVCDAKTVDSINSEPAIHDGHGVASHFGGRGLMPITYNSIADEALDFSARHSSRHDFALGKRAKFGGVADLPTEFYARYGGLEVIRG